MGRFVDWLRESKRAEKKSRFESWPKSYKGPVMLAEGDSWFEYPFADDIVMHLSRRYKIYPLARAGDTLAAVEGANDIDTALSEVTPDFVLLSAGGNDIVDRLSQYVHRFSLARRRTGKAYVKWTEFGNDVDFLAQRLERVCRKLVDKGIDVIVSGYDYPNPRVPQTQGAQWIGPVLSTDCNIHDIPLWHWITQAMIDEYDRRLRVFAEAFNAATQAAAPSATTKGEFVFVSQIDAVYGGTYDPRIGGPHASWTDEMHPTSAGFGRAADRVAAAIDGLWARRSVPTV